MYIKRSKIQVKSLIYPILEKVLESLIYYYLCAGNQTMIMAKEKVNYQEVYDLYQLCSETKDLLHNDKY